VIHNESKYLQLTSNVIEEHQVQFLYHYNKFKKKMKMSSTFFKIFIFCIYDISVNILKILNLYIFQQIIIILYPLI